MPKHQGQPFINPPYGNMYAYESDVDITVAQANVWYEVASGLTGGNESGCTFQNSHEILINRTGKYLVMFSVSMSTGAANDEIQASVGIDNAADTTGAAHGTVKANDADIAVAGSAILSITAASVLSVFVMNESAARDINIEHVSVSVLLIG